MLGPLLKVQMRFGVAGARDSAPVNARVWLHFQKRRQAWDIWRGSGQMHVAWQAQYKTCSSEMLGGQGADFLRGVVFWSSRSSCLRRWAGAALDTDGAEKSQNALVQYVAVSSLREVSQNCFVFDFANLDIWGRLAELLRSLTLSTSKIDAVS